MADKNINSILFNGYHTFKDLIFKILGMRNFLNQKVNFWVIKSGFSKSLSFDKKQSVFRVKKTWILNKYWFFGIKSWLLPRNFQKFYLAYYARLCKTTNKKTNSILCNDNYGIKDLIFKSIGMQNFLNQKINV